MKTWMLPLVATCAVLAGFAYSSLSPVHAHCGVCGIEGKPKQKDDGHTCKGATEGQLCLECTAKLMRLTAQQKEALQEAFQKYNDSVVTAKESLMKAVEANLQAAQAEKFRTAVLGKKKGE